MTIISAYIYSFLCKDYFSGHESAWGHVEVPAELTLRFKLVIFETFFTEQI